MFWDIIDEYRAVVTLCSAGIGEGLDDIWRSITARYPNIPISTMTIISANANIFLKLTTYSAPHQSLFFPANTLANSLVSMFCPPLTCFSTVYMRMYFTLLFILTLYIMQLTLKLYITHGNHLVQHLLDSRYGYSVGLCELSQVYCIVMGIYPFLNHDHKGFVGIRLKLL